RKKKEELEEIFKKIKKEHKDYIKKIKEHEKYMKEMNEPTVHLLATGSIVPNLHYNPFLHDWWYVKFIKENRVTKQTFYLFQVGYKCKTEIKGLQIITRIVQRNMLNSQVLGFCCEENEISDNLSNNPT
ncbi:14408_t:CDS:2, partial [Cetraspora pellucida]